MSRTLKLVDQLLLRSRHLQHFGRYDEAFVVLNRLARFGELPSGVEEKVERRLGVLCLRTRRYKRARRHLGSALHHQPKDARNHYLLATALVRGSEPDMPRALQHYQRSVELDPAQPARLCVLGILLIKLGLAPRGLRFLRKAIQIAPEDMAILRKVVQGMQLANRAKEMRELIVAARFRRPDDRRVAALWNELQFNHVRKAQQMAQQRVTLVSNETPVLLRFLGATSAASPARRPRMVRQDPPSGIPAPRNILRVRRPDQRHAL